jgi:hypothetical protein
MQWMKQTFVVRFNVYAGRLGHIRGDRYWSGGVRENWNYEGGTAML